MSSSELEIEWISLENASEITGASLAIIQDTIRKYQDNPLALRCQSIDGEVFVDKKQIINLFPASASALEKEKIPGTLFRWFDDLRRAYETSVNTMFKRVEQVKDQHKLDVETQYKLHIKMLEKKHQQQLKQFAVHYKQMLVHNKKTIEKLEQDSEFYQQQITAQQQTIAKLNSRYDAVILALKDKERLTEKDITPSMPSAHETHKTIEQTTADTTAPDNTDIAEILNQAFAARADKDLNLAAELFTQAAYLGDEKAMGALGRCYCIGEGVDKNLEQGLAWLYLAAEFNFEPAVIKINQAKHKTPEALEKAIQLADALAIQIKLKQTENS
ncbi:hypothetical protein DS2_04495 [Catenovulum agarivorans DS-2]|uniref:Sel1 repeat family protein n=1 Tax=Catenovulum agarivorans DS-2 TaxID=1328313 RepID=W7QET5_9ALTE|nr:sel1 repeat family protein [Catenovulum agarivorans]EWH11404.1 hypothetical protein DS2_04495 [Catenovulum agarivorans DS-2]